MTSIPPQSKILKKSCYLDSYNDIVLSNDVRQAASKLVTVTIEFAKLCFYDGQGISHKFSLKKFQQNWPTVSEFTIFSVLPRIESFMMEKYAWLLDFPHSIRHLNEIITSNQISYSIFEICFGAARVSFPVVQATFSIYFVFEINRLMDPNAEIMVRYFLEGMDEEFIPDVNDGINLTQVKTLIKKKLALSSFIMLDFSPSIDESIRFENKFKQLIQNKKEMLGDLNFQNEFSSPDQSPFFPCEYYQTSKRSCSLHIQHCPIVNENKRHLVEEPHTEFKFEDFALSGIMGEEKLLPEKSISSSSLSSGSSSYTITSKDYESGGSIGEVSLSVALHKSFTSYYDKNIEKLIKTDKSQNVISTAYSGKPKRPSDLSSNSN